MSVREFAKHLGVSDRLVSKWEAGGSRLSPHPANQSVLDRSLENADESSRHRFQELLAAGESATRAVAPPKMCQLEPDITDFTGRAAEADQLAAHLTSGVGSGVRIVAIYGKGGLGKTTLAVHVAHLVRDRFSDGQFDINLRGTQTQKLDAGEVLGRFLRELDLPPGSIPDDIDDRARLLRAQLADRRVLLLLDNAVDEQHVRPLLPGSSGCAVIVTSRRFLGGLAGAHHHQLDVMSPAQGVEFLAAMIGESRVRAEPDAAAEIVTLCGMLPLALRIAGSRLSSRRASSLAGFAERLRDERSRLDQLRAGDLEVRASFALSYDACPDELRGAFRLLGMLEATNFPAWVLAVLAEVPVRRAEDLLEGLVDAELIEATTEEMGLQRYRFHDLLRLFAHERLLDEDDPAVRRDSARRLLDHYLRLCTAAAGIAEPAGPVVTEPCLPEATHTVERDPDAWFRSERSGLLTAVDLANELELWDYAWRLAEQVGTLLRRQSAWTEWDRTLRAGLRAVRESGSLPGAARIHRSLGLLHRDQGRFGPAFAELNRSADIFGELDDKVGVAVSNCHLGQTYRYTGDLHKGVAKFREALPVLERAGDARITAVSLSGLGDIYRGLSRWAESIECLDRAIAMFTELGDTREVARAQVRLGIVWRDRCRFGKAEELYLQGLRTFSGFDDRRWAVQVLRHLGVLYRNMGLLDLALDDLEQAKTGLAEYGDHRGVAVTLRNIGDCQRRQGNVAAAERSLRGALSQFQELGDVRWAARTLVGLADLDTARDRHDAAIGQLAQAQAVFSEIADEPGTARVLRSRGLAYRAAGRYPEALGAFGASRGLYATLGDQVWAARVLASRAATLRLAGDADWSRHLEQARQECVAADAGSADEADQWLVEW